MPKVRKPNDAALYNVLSVLIAHGRFDTGDPGEVLYNLADEAATGYFDTAHAVRYFEEEGWVEVDRLYHSAPAKANRIISITIIEEELK